MENTALVWILVALVVAFGLVTSYGVYTVTKPDLSGLATKDEMNALGNAVVSLGNSAVTKDEMANLATKEDLKTITPIIPEIQMPAIPEINIEGDIVNKVDRLCGLTNGCERWDMDEEDADILINYLNNSEWKKLRKNIEEITVIDYDDYEELEVIVKDQMAYATDEDAEDEGDYTAELKLRVKYREESEDEWSVAYLHVTGTIEDSEDVAITSIIQVEKSFELE